MEKFRISVRSLVEFLLHSGDIDGGKGGMADKEAMQLGSRIHRKIQGSMGAGYRPEVSLKAEIVKETFTLSGACSDSLTFRFRTIPVIGSGNSV